VDGGFHAPPWLKGLRPNARRTLAVYAGDALDNDAKANAATNASSVRTMLIIMLA